MKNTLHISDAYQKVFVFGLVSLIFFANALFLPHGLLYSTLLTPFLLFNLALKKRLKYVLGISIFLSLFTVFHFENDINFQYYLKSGVLYFSVITFIVSFYFFQKKYSIERFFKALVLINTVLFLVALLTYFVPFLRDYFWYTTEATRHMRSVLRLKLLTYEPSYYSLMLTPIFLYYALGLIIHKNKKHIFPLILITIPLLWSLSFGIIGGIVLTLLILCLVHLPRLLRQKRTWRIVSAVVLIGIPIYLLLFHVFPENIINLRFQKIFSGQDTSANGRTFEAILVGYKITESTNLFFGAGIGQIKNLGKDVILDFYKYQGEYAKILTIPNAFAETLAIFGVIGAALRILVQFVLFFLTKVYSNYLRLTLFIFLFIYQFTGSYITSILEYMLWVLAFSASFQGFNKLSKTGEGSIYQ
ncbi:MAG: hypothetical protein MRY83_03465 [Flavobacteriales bacterium]|nr:hypothetical protein [Flavobacteriales bacterium]